MTQDTIETPNLTDELVAKLRTDSRLQRYSATGEHDRLPERANGHNRGGQAQDGRDSQRQAEALANLALIRYNVVSENGQIDTARIESLDPQRRREIQERLQDHLRQLGQNGNPQVKKLLEDSLASIAIKSPQDATENQQRTGT